MNYTHANKIQDKSHYNLTHISIQTSPLHKPQKTGGSLPAKHRSFSVSSGMKVLVSSKKDMDSSFPNRWEQKYKLPKSNIHIVQCQFSQIDRSQGQDTNLLRSNLREMDALQLHTHMLLLAEECSSLLGSYFP